LPNGYVYAIPKFNHTATLLGDGRVLVVGGEGYGGFDRYDTPAVYDPVKDVWTNLNFAQARAGHRALLLPDGRVLIAGGYLRGIDPSSYPSHIGTGSTIADPEIYDPATDSISPLAAPMAPRRDFAMVQLIDGEILMIGGSNDN